MNIKQMHTAPTLYKWPSLSICCQFVRSYSSLRRSRCPLGNLTKWCVEQSCLAALRARKCTTKPRVRASLCKMSPCLTTTTEQQDEAVARTSATVGHSPAQRFRLLKYIFVQISFWLTLLFRQIEKLEEKKIKISVKSLDVTQRDLWDWIIK